MSGIAALQCNTRDGVWLLHVRAAAVPQCMLAAWHDAWPMGMHANERPCSSHCAGLCPS